MLFRSAGTYNSVARPADTVQIPGNLTVTGTVTGNLNASNITTGIVPVANGGTGSPTKNFVDLTTTQTIAGGKTLSDNLRTSALTRAGSETGTAQAPFIATSIGTYNGLVTRRVTTTSSTAGQIVARTNVLRLERDGTSGGWLLSNDDLGGTEDLIQSVFCLGINSGGTVVTRLFELNGNGPGTTVLFTDAQNVGYFQCSFGNSRSPGHQTQVVLQRTFNTFLFANSRWVGTVTSTYNQ